MPVKTHVQNTLYVCIILCTGLCAACGPLESNPNDPSQYFEDLPAIQNHLQEPPYCDPVNFVPPTHAVSVPEGCDEDTDPLTPCHVGLYTFDEPAICSPAREVGSDECNQRASSFVPQDQTWSCDTRTKPNTLNDAEHAYDSIIGETKRDIANGSAIPDIVFAPPNDAFIDATNGRGLRTSRTFFDPNNEHITSVYYTYDTQDRISAWAIVQGSTRLMSGRMDANGTLRVLKRSTAHNPSECTMHFDASGRLRTESCQTDPSLYVPTYNASYDCRGFLTSRRSRWGETHPSNAEWTYDDFGRLVRHTQENSTIFEEYTATYAQNPAQPVEAPPCP